MYRMLIALLALPTFAFLMLAAVVGEAAAAAPAADPAPVEPRPTPATLGPSELSRFSLARPPAPAICCAAMGGPYEPARQATVQPAGTEGEVAGVRWRLAPDSRAEHFAPLTARPLNRITIRF